MFEWTPCVWCSTGQPNIHSPSRIRSIGSIFEPFQLLKIKNFRNTLDISKYVTCSAKTFSYWYLRSASLKVVFLQQFIHLTAKLRTAWFTSFLSGPPVYNVLQGIPISTHPPGVEKSSFNTICGSGSWWSTPPSFNPRPPFYLFIWFSLLWAEHHGPWHNSKDCRESNLHLH